MSTKSGFKEAIIYYGFNPEKEDITVIVMEKVKEVLKTFFDSPDENLVPKPGTKFIELTKEDYIQEILRLRRMLDALKNSRSILRDAANNLDVRENLIIEWNNESKIPVVQIAEGDDNEMEEVNEAAGNEINGNEDVGEGSGLNRGSSHSISEDSDADKTPVARIPKSKSKNRIIESDSEQSDGEISPKPSDAEASDAEMSAISPKSSCSKTGEKGQFQKTTSIKEKKPITKKRLLDHDFSESQVSINNSENI